MDLKDVDRKSLVRHGVFKFKRCVKKRAQLYTATHDISFM